MSGKINRITLALKVIADDPHDRLSDQERLLIVRLLCPGLADTISRPPQRGRTRSATVALEAGKIARTYFYFKALLPRAKHKEEIAPLIKQAYSCSPRKLDNILNALTPKRRQRMEAEAAAIAAETPNNTVAAIKMAARRT
jgi:hypothetical protein